MDKISPESFSDWIKEYEHQDVKEKYMMQLTPHPVARCYYHPFKMYFNRYAKTLALKG